MPSKNKDSYEKPYVVNDGSCTMDTHSNILLTKIFFEKDNLLPVCGMECEMMFDV